MHTKTILSSFPFTFPEEVAGGVGELIAEVEVMVGTLDGGVTLLVSITVEVEVEFNTENEDVTLLVSITTEVEMEFGTEK